jgi:hypothetical protein
MADEMLGVLSSDGSATPEIVAGFSRAFPSQEEP